MSHAFQQAGGFSISLPWSTEMEDKLTQSTKQERHGFGHKCIGGIIWHRYIAARRNEKKSKTN